MNEEMMMNENNEIMEVNEDTCVRTEEVNESGNGLLKLAVVTIGAAGAVGAYLYKNRGKLKMKKEDRMIKKLEKGGYTVIKDEDYGEEFEVVEGELFETKE